MKAAASKRTLPLARIGVVVLVVCAVTIGILVARDNASAPSTDNATIDADVVHVAAAVGGRVIEIDVRENGVVQRGDVLFRIDPEPFALAVAQAEADLALAEASLATQRRILSTQRSTASVAVEQTRRAETNLALSRRTVDRLAPLAAEGYVPVQQLDQAQVAQHDASTSLAQARTQQSATLAAVDTEAAAQATVAARKAALGIARRALSDSTVRAGHAGRIVGLAMSTGEVVAPSQSLFTLIDTEEWFAVGNFRETEISSIAVGDCATVYSLIDRRQALHGSVDGIGSGVLDPDRLNLPRSLPYIERSLNWVRVAQRFPVRIRIHDADGPTLKLGASAVIQIRHGAACRERDASGPR